MPSIERWRYPTSGIASYMISPSVLMMKRITPWVEGCCGPMLSVISSPLSAYARTISLMAASSGHEPRSIRGPYGPRSLHSLALLAHSFGTILRRGLVEHGQEIERVGARGG